MATTERAGFAHLARGDLKCLVASVDVAQEQSAVTHESVDDKR
jgi:hypothetical protein